MRVLLISGSLRRPSYTTAALRHIAAALQARGAAAELWDFKDRPLPIFDPEYEGGTDRHPDHNVRAFAAAARAADAFVLGSPNYHNSYSGVLKNALDYLGPEVRHKPVGIVAQGHGVAAVQPADHLRIVVRGVLGYALTTQVVTTPEDFDADYRIVSHTILRRIDRFVEELLFLGERLRTGTAVEG